MKTQDWPQHVAHDLRSPIAVLTSYLEFKSNQILAADEEEYLVALRNSVAKLIAITDELAASATSNPTRLVSVNASAVHVTDSLAGNDTILVVDDDLGMRLQWRRLLTKKGFKIIEARSGEELLSMSLAYESLRMAIVDYQFEGSDLNGLDVIEYLKRKNVELVHMCTGNFDDPEVCRQARQLGAASVLSKPFNLQAIDAAIGA